MRRRITIWNRIGLAIFAAAAATVLIWRRSWPRRPKGAGKSSAITCELGCRGHCTAPSQAFDEHGLRKSQWLWQQADRLEADSSATAADFMGGRLSFVQFSNRPTLDINALGGMFWRDDAVPPAWQSVATPQPAVPYDEWTGRPLALAAPRNEVGAGKCGMVAAADGVDDVWSRRAGK